MQRNPRARVTLFVVAVMAATGILVAAGLGERTAIDRTEASKAIATARQ